MSRLDNHVRAVQNRLALLRLVEALVWAVLAFAAGFALVIVAERALRYTLPRPVWFVCGGIGVAFFAAMLYAVLRRPSARYAAIAIDEKLGLKEKISTALYVRPSNDPFAVAAVRDAERTAENVVVQSGRYFPLRVPVRATYLAIGMLLLAFGLKAWMPEMDLFGRQARQQRLVEAQMKHDQAKVRVEQALAVVNAVPQSVANDEAIKQAKIDLTNMLNSPIKDTAAANRSAMKAMQDVEEALKQQIEQNAKFAEAQNQAKMVRNLDPGPDQKGPVAEAQREMAKGNITSAIEKLNEVAAKFDKMDAEQQKAAAQQMQQMAQQLQQMAQANPQQAQKMMQQMQQQAQQMMQQMNNGQGPTQQQQQQLQQMMQQAQQGQMPSQQQLQQLGMNQQQAQQMQQQMQQMQAQAQGQQGAQQMAQAAQKMAQAMQQAAQQQQQQGGQQQQGQQQQGQQQQAQGGQQGQQPGQQNGQQQAQGQGQHQMQQAMQQMQQQMQDMEQSMRDMEQMQAAQQDAQAAADQAAGDMNGNGNNQADGQPQPTEEQKKQWGNNTGEWKAGDPNGQFGPGMGGPGQGNGGRAGERPAPFGVKKVVSHSKDDDKGKILAANLIKDNQPIKGKGKLGLQQVAEAAQKEAPDEVDQERVSRQAQSAVKEYFNSMAKEEPAPAPSPAPAPAPAGK
jgi:hypothetical protein